MKQARSSKTAPAASLMRRRTRPGTSSATTHDTIGMRRGRMLHVHAKLLMGSKNSPAERRADATADRVMRKCAANCGCAKCQQKETGGAGPAVRETGGIPISTGLETRIRRMQSGGSPLPAATRARMEPALGQDLGAVRIHRGAEAADTAADMGAQAYTIGNHIAFGRGKFAPGTETGDRLIAHELSHVADNAVRPGQVRRKPDDEALEATGSVGIPFAVKVDRTMYSDEFLVEFVRQWNRISADDARDLIARENIHWLDQDDLPVVTQDDVDKGFKMAAVLVEDVGPTGDLAEYRDYMGGLDPEEAAAINSATDTWFWDLTGYKKGQLLDMSDPDDRFMADTWITLRNELLSRRRKIENLPPRIRDFLFSKDATRAMRPADYDAILRIAALLETLSPSELDDYKRRPTRAVKSLRAFERSIRRYIEQLYAKRANDPIFGPTDEEIRTGEEGVPVERQGLVQIDTGTALMAEADPASAVLATLPLNTRVFVAKDMGNDWLSVYVEGHQRGAPMDVAEGSYGFVAKSALTTDMPDPQAWLFRITKSGQGALDVAKEVYGGHFKASWGKDFRYLVNVLVSVNDAKGRRYLRKDKPGASWDETVAIKDGQIWVPGLKLVDALHGHVKSGSISYEVLTTIGDILMGAAAFIVGLLHGAAMSVADIFVGIYDLAKLAKDVVVKIIRGNLISSIKAFYHEIKKLSLKQILAMVGAKWNAPNIWDRWKFRGYVIGYAIVEILLMIYSVGAITAIKWAGRVGKFGKLGKYLSSLPRVKKTIDAASAMKGKSVEKLRKAMKAGQAISKAHAWAADVLRLPLHILRRLTTIQVERLKKLPQWARERFASLADKAKLRLLGCRSPCKVDVHEIEAALKLTGKGGKKLTTAREVLDVLEALPSGKIRTWKIWRKLSKKNSAIMVAIQKAGLTKADLKKLDDFLTPGDFANPEQAYATFVRYVNAVVPAKIGKDPSKLNDIAEAMVKAEKGRGRAMKGAMFEQWVALHVTKIAGRNFTRTSFDMGALFGKKTPPIVRKVDKWVPDRGEIWEIKHQFSKVPKKQVKDYEALLTAKSKAPDGKKVKSVNYLFPTREAAEANRHLRTAHGFNVYYVGAKGRLTSLP